MTKFGEFRWISPDEGGPFPWMLLEFLPNEKLSLTELIQRFPIERCAARVLTHNDGTKYTERMHVERGAILQDGDCYWAFNGDGIEIRGSDLGDVAKRLVETVRKES